MCTSSTSNPSATSPRSNEKPCKIARAMAFNMFKYVFFIFRYYLDLAIESVFRLIWDGCHRKIPDLDKRDHMLSESAVSLAAQIRNKQLKSEDLMRSCIDRIKAVNPMLNAVTDERFEDAVKDAQEVDRMIANGLSDEYFKEKPFLGVPFTAKESHAVAGLLHTLGVVARRHMKATEDAECVRLLRNAGAIPVAVTNVPEINKWQESRNMVFGGTNNPYHTGRTTGGSSGGEGALAAARASPISLCSDIGGSTRMPAFYCGLFALNPTPGYTSLKGSALRSGEDPTMASIGFISPHVEDLAPLTRIVAAGQADQLGLDKRPTGKNMRIFYTETCADLRVSPVCKELRKAMTDVINKLSSGKPSGGQAPLPYYHTGFDHMFAIWKHAMSKETEDFPKMLTNNQGEAKAWRELAKKIIGQSDYTMAAILKLFDEQVLPSVNPQWADSLTTSLKADLMKTLGDDGVLIFPSAPAPAPYHHLLLLRPFNFAYWGVFNALHFPSVQVPLGLSSEGLPLGIQVVAAPRNEGLCLAIAEKLSQIYGGAPLPCKVY